jgi:hypothetical protein
MTASDYQLTSEAYIVTTDFTIRRREPTEILWMYQIIKRRKFDFKFK